MNRNSLVWGVAQVGLSEVKQCGFVKDRGREYRKLGLPTHPFHLRTTETGIFTLQETREMGAGGE